MPDRVLPNWIKAYLTYTAESESPEDFHRWVAVSMIASALRRQVYFDMGYFLLYPNAYIILVSPAGRCKKSTAMRIGRATLEPVEGITYSSDSTTRERLIQDIAQSYHDGHSSMSAFSSEFASLVTSSGLDMVMFLTDIYDCPPEWSHRTKSGGTNKIVAPCLNLLGATTPEWIARAMPLDTIGVGLTSRIVFVYQVEPRVRNPFPRLSKEQQELYKLLVHDLSVISATNGEYNLTEEAEEWYTPWYRERVKDPNTSGDPRLAGYYERKYIHLLKLSMVIAAAQTSETVITKENLSDAMNILVHTEEHMPKVFANVGKNPLNVDLEETLVVILSSPQGVSYAELLERFKHSVRKDEMTEVIDTLVAMGHIRAVAEKGKGMQYYGNASS